jgi:hypothetical protein
MPGFGSLVRRGKNEIIHRSLLVAGVTVNKLPMLLISRGFAHVSAVELSVLP